MAKAYSRGNIKKECRRDKCKPTVEGGVLNPSMDFHGSGDGQLSSHILVFLGTVDLDTSAGPLLEASHIQLLPP